MKTLFSRRNPKPPLKAAQSSSGYSLFTLSKIKKTRLLPTLRGAHRDTKLALDASKHRSVVEVNGFEPSTSCLQSRRSPS